LIFPYGQNRESFHEQSVATIYSSLLESTVQVVSAILAPVGNHTLAVVCFSHM